MPLLFAAYLSLAIHLGLVGFYKSIWGLPVIAGCFALQGLAIRYLGGKERFHSLLISVLFAQSPLVLLILNFGLGQVLSFRILLSFVIGLVVLFSIIAWKKRIGRAQLKIVFALSVPLTLLFAFGPYLRLSRFSNEWRLLAEEGQMMAWVTKALHGGIPYKDMIVTRGPFMIYSTAAAIKLWGASLLIARMWQSILALIAGYAALCFCASFVRSSLLRWAAFLTLFLIQGFNPRIGFSLLALGLYRLAIEKNDRRYSFGAGLSLALAFLTSVEAAASALIAVVAGSIAGFFLDREKNKLYPPHLGLILAGLGILILPMVVLIAINSSLSDVLQGVLIYPKYAAQGYASVPYVNLVKMIQLDALSGHWSFPVTRKIFAIWYMPILIYLFTFFLFLRWSVRRRINTEMVMLFVLSVYGWTLFHSALGRSDFHHLYFCVPPALILSLVHADRLWRALRQAGSDLGAHVLIFLVLCCWLPLWFMVQRPQDRIAPLFVTLKENLSGHWDQDRQYKEFRSPRLAGLVAPPGVRNRIDTVVGIIQSHKKPEDSVYAFPNLPLYYFLLDSPNPTRYEWAYQAITHAMRLEAVRDLERAKPQYVIFSTDPRQRLDHIPPSIAVPEILSFIRDHYKRWTVVGREEILIPKESSLPQERAQPIETGVPETESTEDSEQEP